MKHRALWLGNVSLAYVSEKTAIKYFINPENCLNNP